MRILFDHQVFSLQDTGGISRYHYELIKNLQFVDHVRMELLIGGNASALPFAEMQSERTKITSWRTSLRPNYARYAMNEALSLATAPLRGKYDVYHPTLNRIMPFVRHRRIIVTQHDSTHERFPHLFRNPEAYMRAKRHILSRADAILCVSESSRQDLLHFYDIDEKKTYIIHHGFTPLDEGIRTKFVGVTARSPLVPYLLYVGSRTEYKNFRLLLEAFALSGLASDFRLIAVGGGPGSVAETAHIAQFGVSGHVDLIAKASDPELASLYRNASLFVYPSLYEGFGFPPLEAMSLGCPVLANRTSSLPEICGDAAFYFNAQDPAELSAALLATLSNEAALREKRSLGFEQVKRYDWSTTARRTLEVYAAS